MPAAAEGAPEAAEAGGGPEVARTTGKRKAAAAAAPGPVVEKFLREVVAFTLQVAGHRVEIAQAKEAVEAATAALASASADSEADSESGAMAGIRAAREADLRSKEGALQDREWALRISETNLAAWEGLLAEHLGRQYRVALPVPELHKYAILQWLGEFLADYEFAEQAPARGPTASRMGESDAADDDSDPSGNGVRMPYRVPSGAADAIGKIFAQNVRYADSHDRRLHPIGVLAGAPGTGKSRGLLELADILMDPERCRPSGIWSLNEAERAALEALQAGRYGRVDLLLWTYGNDKLTETDGELGAQASTAMRMLHAATCAAARVRRRAARSFGEFMGDLSAAGFKLSMLKDLQPSNVMDIIRKRRGVAEDEPWLLLVGVDDLGSGLFESGPGPTRIASIGNPGFFLLGAAMGLNTLLSSGRATQPGSLPRTAVVVYMAGSLPSVVVESFNGPVFRPNGLVPKHVPLAPLSWEDCAACCDAQPQLAGRWRTLREFRALMEAVGGRPSLLEKLLAATCARLAPGALGPRPGDPAMWAAIGAEMRDAVANTELMDSYPGLDLALICQAMVGGIVLPNNDLPGVAVDGDPVRWAWVEERGAAVLSLPRPAPALAGAAAGAPRAQRDTSTHRALSGALLSMPYGAERLVVVPPLFIALRVRGAGDDAQTVAPELLGLRTLLERWPLPASAMHSAAGAGRGAGPGAGSSGMLTWQAFEELVALWEAVRLELMCALMRDPFQYAACGLKADYRRAPRKKRNVTLDEYFAAGRVGLNAAAAGEGDWDDLLSLAMMPPPTAQVDVRRAAARFPDTPRPTCEGQPLDMSNGYVHLNAAAPESDPGSEPRSPFGGSGYFTVRRCAPDAYHPRGIAVLIVGQCLFRQRMSVLKTQPVLEAYAQVARALEAGGLMARFRGRWLFVLHTTARAEVDLAALPLNAVLMDADSMEAHMGPVLADSLRLMIRGRRFNANVATDADLRRVEGFAKANALARGLLQEREAAGEYRGWADLCARVPGVGKRFSEDDVEF